MPPAGFETAVSASERRQIHALVCTATGIGILLTYSYIMIKFAGSWLYIQLREPNGVHNVDFACWLQKHELLLADQNFTFFFQEFQIFYLAYVLLSYLYMCALYAGSSKGPGACLL